MDDVSCDTLLQIRRFHGGGNHEELSGKAGPDYCRLSIRCTSGQAPGAVACGKKLLDHLQHVDAVRYSLVTYPSKTSWILSGMPNSNWQPPRRSVLFSWSCSPPHVLYLRALESIVSSIFIELDRFVHGLGNSLHPGTLPSAWDWGHCQGVVIMQEPLLV